MIDITLIDRAMTREQWAQVHRILRKCGTMPRPADDYNASIAAQVNACAENGKVAVNYSGMDCDCAQFSGSVVLPALPVAVRHYIDDALKWADGLLSHRVERPSERARPWSRDLAMEAFENGHPYSIHI